MASTANEPTASNGSESRSRMSSVPLLGEGFSESANRASGTKRETVKEARDGSEIDSKTGKRRFWGLGKKKEDEKMKKNRQAVFANTSQTDAYMPAMRPVSPVHPPGVAHTIVTASHPYGSPASPGRNLPSSSSHVPSPASSQIFERNVQEEGPLIATSPAIPGHITTENHIPPALDASTQAITDNHLDPDHVEIVTHPAHQPAAVTVTGAALGDVSGLTSQDDLVARSEPEDTASNYGALDVNDVRRLSFISFADVMHAEHADHAGMRDNDHLSGTSSVAPMTSLNRSPSPVLSPVSSHGMGGTPPTSGSASFKGLDSSPSRGTGPLASQHSGPSPPTGGELTIETMRQALRKTGSGDLSSARSQPISAVGGDETIVE